MASRAPAEPAPRSAEPGRTGRPRIQAALQITQPGDAAEREAVTTARRVMAMRAAPVGTYARGIARVPAVPVPHPSAPAAVTAQPTATRDDVPPAIEAAIGTAVGGGAALGDEVRSFAEPRFRADFSRVRVHTDRRAANLATRLNARAFTYGRDIFFNAGQYQPQTPAGMELIAHELTHTVQQREAVQRDGWGSPLDWIADRVNLIPGFRLLTLILGVNPVNMRAVERSAANVLRAMVEFLPGGGLIVEALDRYGVFDRVGQWADTQLRGLGMVGSAFRAALDAFLGSLSILDLADIGGVWNRARRIFSDPVDRVLGFARSLGGQILGFIREAILRPLGALAANTRGYDLLRAVLGFDPVTGETVPRSPELLIGGFMRLVGQEEVWENIRRSGAIARGWAWFQGALGGLAGLVTSIPGRFTALLRSLEITDLVIVTRALGKVASAFASFIGDFIGWGIGTVINLLQIIVEVVAPGVMPYIRRAAGAFQTILRNPVGFVRTLVSAAALGFRQFAGRFLTHLQASLVGWLTGAMAGAGVYVPQGFNLREILKFALSVMGLTWANIRTKLVRATSETVVRALETGFDIVRTLVTEGPAAAWQQIVQGLTNLREMVIGQVMEFVRTRIVQAAVTRLVSLLTPAGAFIQAILATYNTVMFFVERLRQIAQVAASFIDSLATIAAGTIAPAANRVESTMAGLLTLVISFLARIAGLGRVSDAVIGIINRIRAPIDRALDRVVAWIVAQARRVGRWLTGGSREGRAGGGTTPAAGAARSVERFAMGSASHTLTVTTDGTSSTVIMASAAGSLGGKIGVLSARVSQSTLKNKDRIINKLGKISAKLDINAMITELQKRNMPRFTDDFIRDYNRSIIGEIVNLAARENFTDLVYGAFLPNPLPSVRHIPSPVKSDIRARLYERGSAWTGVQRSEVRKGVAAIDAEIALNVLPAIAAGDMAAAQAAMKSMKDRGKVLEGATLKDFLPGTSYVTPRLRQYAVDHDPSLAEHWVAHGGNRVSDAARRATVEGKGGSSLDLVTSRFNSQKSSRNLQGELQKFTQHAFISPPFTSEIAKDVNGNANSVDAVTIDSYSLTDAGGVPFLPV